MNEMIDKNKISSKYRPGELDFSFVLASSVHDMKNSLGMLLNSLEEVIRHGTEEDKEQQERFSILQYEATRINTELVQLLSLYRFQNRTQMVNVDECYLYDTIEDQLSRNDVLFKTQNINVDLQCDADLVWYYDQDLIGSVIHNVLVKGTRYANSKMVINAYLEDDYLMIEISDDGNGFPDSMIGAASLDSDAHKDGNSTQLGLFFAAKIAESHQQKEHNGYIKLSNGGQLGGGVFTIALP